MDPQKVQAQARLWAIVPAAYVCVALAFAWPLPLHLGSLLPGPVSQDTGVYVWNLWVFRHEIVAHHRLPFATLEILSLAGPVPLALHNYTTIADLLAFPILPLLGTIRTFNILIIGSGAISAYAMFLFARRATGDAAAAWLAGLLFGFSPYMSARTSEHFSLVQTAPLVLFALLLDRLRTAPTIAAGLAAGATVGLAYLCDPYYAVYCVLMAAFATACSSVRLHEPDPAAVVARGLRRGVDVVIVLCAALAAWILAGGGGRYVVLGVRISVTQLYTPILLLTAAAALRIWMAVRPRITWVAPTLPPIRVVVAAALTCVAVLAPVVLPVTSPGGERQWISPKVFWRSSAAGLDLLTLFTPNPLHPWFGQAFDDWLASLPNTPIENVASIPWTVLALVIAALWCCRTSLPRYWIAFTLFFGSLALGPFVHIAGHNWYVPTPWALLRYVPIVGAARMPTRMIAVVMLGVAMLLAFAMLELRRRVAHPARLVAAASALLLFELLPSPRPTYSAQVPGIFKIVAADPRPLAVLSLPFGLRDGLTSYGNATPMSQFFQTFHGKPLIGGYVSRLPSRGVAEYRHRVVTAALIDLSEGRPLSDDRRAHAVRRAHEVLPQLNIGYVVVNRSRASGELIQFAHDAFDLEAVASEGERTLFRTPLARAPVTAASTPRAFVP